MKPTDVSRTQLVQSAESRLAEAKSLEQEHCDGACYLSGYTVECYLKAVIMKSLGLDDTTQVVDAVFEPHVTKGRDKFFIHRYSTLRDRFAKWLPAPVQAALSALPEEVMNWDPQWRYIPAGRTPQQAGEFVAAVAAFREKAKEAV